MKTIREDGKIDLSLNQTGYLKVIPLADEIIKKLRENQGFIAINDKSSPQIIYNFLGISKKSYKLAISYLYKQKIIKLEETGIRLIK
ncbi:MAG: hypothetical protein GY817_01595 [bacterium]|nr:hypothetical protein [bacterium]